MPAPQAIESALIAEVSKHSDGIDAVTLLEKLRDKGFEIALVRAALVDALNRGKVRLGRDLRLAILEDA